MLYTLKDIEKKEQANLDLHGLQMDGLNSFINDGLADEGDIPGDCAVEVVFNVTLGRVETRRVYPNMEHSYGKKVLVGYFTNVTGLQDLADKIANTVDEAKKKGWLDEDDMDEEDMEEASNN